jgi:hypothetical protein
MAPGSAEATQAADSEVTYRSKPLLEFIIIYMSHKLLILYGLLPLPLKLFDSLGVDVLSGCIR